MVAVAHLWEQRQFEKNMNNHSRGGIGARVIERTSHKERYPSSSIHHDDDLSV